MKFKNLLAVLCVLIMAGCGTSGGGDDTAPVPFTPTLTLTTSLTTGSQLAQGGSTTVTAMVTDDNGDNVADGTEVLFTASGGSITASVLTVSGEAIASYNAASSGGTVTINAIAKTAASLGSDLTGSIALTVGSGPAAAISLKSVTPARLGLRGSGVDEAGTFLFTVKDGLGNLVADGTRVDFKLTSPTGGGEALSASSALTVGGDVSVTVLSGTVPGVATVNTSTLSNGTMITTQSRISMGYGMPDQLHIGLAVEKFNVPGLRTFGVENVLTAYVADRFSNPVPVNTPVYFASECGIVALEDGDGIATNMTNAFGIAAATSITAAPTDPLCRMIMWTEGQEAFTDSNGNGRYDVGEPHVGIGEPFIDANDNGIYDLTETYFDLDGNGAYTAADSTWNGDTFVWTSAVVRWSGNTKEPGIVPESFNLIYNSATLQQQDFNITVTDENNGPLVAGSKVTVSETCFNAVLTGDTDVTIPDSVMGGRDITEFSVTLKAPPLHNFQGGDVVENCTLTVTASSAENGNRTKTINGSVVY